MMMMMEAVRTSETSVDNHFTRQYIPEDNSEQLLDVEAGRTSSCQWSLKGWYNECLLIRCTWSHVIKTFRIVTISDQSCQVGSGLSCTFTLQDYRKQVPSPTCTYCVLRLTFTIFSSFELPTLLYKYSDDHVIRCYLNRLYGHPV
jgi:hypothetical protein